MNDPHAFKNIVWIGSSLKDLKSFSAEVQDVMGYAIYEAQLGLKASCAKPLGGFGGASVMEIVDDHEGDTYRAVYTVRFTDFIYVLHVFQKKSKKGISTPKAVIDLIKKRLKFAEEHYKNASRKDAR
jgi:phage-related protein